VWIQTDEGLTVMWERDRYRPNFNLGEKQM
jgi:hypothetical protein